MPKKTIPRGEQPGEGAAETLRHLAAWPICGTTCPWVSPAAPRIASRSRVAGAVE